MSLSALKKIMDEQGGKGVFYLLGTRKNSGKTTLLNALLQIERMRETACYAAVASVGVDGEERDLVFGTDKPRARLPEGVIVLTSDKAMAASDCLFEPLLNLPINTPLGRLALSRVLREGQCLLVGPDSDLQLRLAAARMREFGANAIYVDGAFNRRSQLLQAGVADEKANFFLCASPESAWDEERFIRETAFDFKVLSLPQSRFAKTALASAQTSDCAAVFKGGETVEPFDLDESAAEKALEIDALFLNVPLAGSVYPHILRLSGAPFELVIKSGASVFLTRRQFDKLTKAGITITQAAEIKPLGVSLKCSALSESSLNPAKCLALAQKSFGSTPVFDLFYENA